MHELMMFYKQIILQRGLAFEREITVYTQYKLHKL